MWHLRISNTLPLLFIRYTNPLSLYVAASSNNYADLPAASLIDKRSEETHSCVQDHQHTQCEDKKILPRINKSLKSEGIKKARLLYGRSSPTLPSIYLHFTKEFSQYAAHMPDPQIAHGPQHTMYTRSGRYGACFLLLLL